jgi:hypothetical protein
MTLIYFNPHHWLFTKMAVTRYNVTQHNILAIMILNMSIFSHYAECHCADRPIFKVLR